MMYIIQTLTEELPCTLRLHHLYSMLCILAQLGSKHLVHLISIYGSVAHFANNLSNFLTFPYGTTSNFEIFQENLLKSDYQNCKIPTKYFLGIIVYTPSPLIFHLKKKNKKSRTLGEQTFECFTPSAPVLTKMKIKIVKF